MSYNLIISVILFLKKRDTERSMLAKSVKSIPLMSTIKTQLVITLKKKRRNPHKAT